MEELETKVRDELAAITDVLEDILGRRSCWNGEVELSDDATMFGKASWSGRIVINRKVAQDDVRWRTLIHEALHTFSVGLTPVAYETLKGWEEGVVEQLQRLLRPRLLQSLGVRVPAPLFLAIEADHPYNLYVDALEGLRLSLGRSEEAFYLHLLSVPLGQRANDVIVQGQQLPEDRCLHFRRVFSASFPRLR